MEQFFANNDYNFISIANLSRKLNKMVRIESQIRFKDLKKLACFMYFYSTFEA